MRRIYLALLSILIASAAKAYDPRPRYGTAVEAAAAASAFNGTRAANWGMQPSGPAPYYGNRVALYRQDCGHECQQLLMYLQSRNIPVVIMDATPNSRYYGEYRQLGGNGAPLVMLGGSQIMSLDGAFVAQRYYEAQQMSGWPPPPRKGIKRPLEEDDLIKPKVQGAPLLAEPEKAATRIRALSTRERCTYLGDESDSYYHVTCGDDTGWLEQRHAVPVSTAAGRDRN